jgi:hypothetical protein
VGDVGAKIDDANLRQSILALCHHGVIAEEIDAGDIDRGVVRDELGPVSLVGCGDRGGDDAVIFRGAIGDEVEQPGPVIGGVLVVGDARQEDLPHAQRIRGAERAHLARSLAGGRAKKVGTIERAFETQVENLVLFLVEPVLPAGGQGPAAEVEAAFRDRVFLHVDERVVVRGPLDGRGRADALRDLVSGAEILDPCLVVAVTGSIDGIGEQVSVVAHLPNSHRHEFFALRKLVDIEHDLFRGIEREVFPAKDRILFPLFGAAVVPPRALFRGWVGIRFLDAPEHFLVECFAHRLERGGDGLGVGVFGAQVGEDGGVILLAEPEEIVDPGVAMK